MPQLIAAAFFNGDNTYVYPQPVHRHEDKSAYLVANTNSNTK